MKRATGEMTLISAGRDRPVTVRKMSTVCPLPVRRSSSRKACVTQMTPVRATRHETKAVKAFLRM
jgi:hypothetical protein